eukprot:gene47267-63348_t
MDEVDFCLDITAVDTTIGFEDDRKPPFYSKELKNMMLGNVVVVKLGYFVQTWCIRYKTDDWNISSVLAQEDADELLICRTNGALERFNRELNHTFPNAHPSMCDFVTAIRQISAEKYAQYDRVAKGREYLQTTIPSSSAAHMLTLDSAHAYFRF